jgi:tetratricopeptide (TPR) repeat protein
MSSKDRRPAFLNASVYRLGLTYLFEGNLHEAKNLITDMEQTIDSYQLRILKGFYKASSGDPDEAIKLYNEILPETRGADTPAVHTLLGDAFREKELWDRAIEHYQQALSRDLSFSAAYYGMGVSYMGKRDITSADYCFKKTLSLDPNNVLALSDTADLMLIQHQSPEDALIYAQRAVAKSPPFYQPYLTMGNVLLVLGREKDAEGFYRKAVEHGLSDYMVPFSKARAYYMKGDITQAKYYISELKRYRNLPEKFKGLIQQKD